MPLKDFPEQAKADRGLCIRPLLCSGAAEITILFKPTRTEFNSEPDSFFGIRLVL